MIFDHKLISGTLIKRYKRFLADILLPNGETLTVHCPNTGTMKTCSTPGSPVRLSVSNNPNRKYPNTFEMIEENGNWVGVNTMRTNGIVAEAIATGKVAEFTEVESIRKEVKVSAKSRLDLLVEEHHKKTYIEIKNCSMAIGEIAMFPDAVTTRGTKHLEELIQLVKDGQNAMLFFLIQRGEPTKFSPARHIDPTYAETLERAYNEGVQVVAYQAEVTPEKIEVVRSLPIEL